MSALTRSRTASTTTAPDQAPSATTAAAPQRTGNQAAQDRAGTSAPAPAPASGLDDALGGLGELSSVVLDALPEAVALPMAWARRGDAWAQQWLDAIPTAAILAAAPEVLKEAIDIAWPDGAGFQVEAAAKASLGADVAGAGAFALERRGESLHIANSGTGSLGLAGGVGESVEGAGFKKSLALGGELSVKDEVALAAEWDIPIGELLGHAIDTAGLLMDLAFQRKNPATALFDAVQAAVKAIAPTKSRVSNQGVGSLSGEVALGCPVNAGAALDLKLGGAVEQEGGVACLEVYGSGLYAARSSNLLSSVLDALGGLEGELALRLGLAGRFRILGDPKALEEGVVEALSFEVVVESTVGDATSADTLAFADEASLRDWLTHGTVEALFEGSSAESVAPEDLPDVALTRGFEHNVGDLAELDALAPDLGREAWDRLSNLIELPDGQGEGAIHDVEAKATAEAKIRVPVAAARAALAGQPLPVDGLLDSAEGRTLDVERAVLAGFLRPGATPPEDLPALDQDAAAPLVEMKDAAVRVSVGLQVGAAGAVALGPVASLGANLGGALTMRLPIEDLPADQRAALLAG